MAGPTWFEDGTPDADAEEVLSRVERRAALWIREAWRRKLWMLKVSGAGASIGELTERALAIAYGPLPGEEPPGE